MRGFRWDIFIDFFIKVLPYIYVTIIYVVSSVFFGFMIGLGIAMLRLSRRKILRGIGSIYVTVLRSVPSVVLLFIVYYGLPLFLRTNFAVELGDINTILYVIVTFSLLLGSPMSEIIRTSYLSVPVGQYEAAVMVGLTPVQAIKRIVFPQGFIIALPNLGNIFIFMMKEGALAYTIGLHDVLGRGMYLSGLKANVYNLELYLALALIYWPCTLVLDKVFKFWEKKLRDRNNKTNKQMRKAIC
ncbi:MAG: amino acid ABC transporter permease [Eubacterium sp.]|nr:amino acid ABC transporter permease [Eubacterium sp.]